MLSPRNSRKQIEENMPLYLDAGAREVWTCDETGAVRFHGSPGGAALDKSELCPEFPSLH